MAKAPAAVGGDVRSELIAALSNNPRASLKRVQSSAAKDMAAAREAAAEAAEAAEST
jgi:hypothetical protein